MIEAQERILLEQGFQQSSGMTEYGTISPTLYMSLEKKVNGKKPVWLIMKETKKERYEPHRARDSNGQEYDMNQLLFHSPFSDLRNTDELISFLQAPDYSKLEAA